MAIDFTPRPYQPPAYEFAAEVPRCNLYADPGLGKTAVMLWLIEALELDSVLVVAPKLVVNEVWCKEPKKWSQFAHLDVVPITGDDDAKVRSTQLLMPPRIAAVNYEQLIWLFYEMGDAWPFRTVIFDESTRLAGFRIRKSARRALALAQHAHTRVDRWVNLTGTPNANGYLKLWGPQWFIDGGVALGRDYGAFQQRWFYRDAVRKSLYSKLKLLPGAQGEIQKRMKSTTFAVRAKDYFDIKDPIERTLTIQLPSEARRMYNTMLRDFYAEIEEGRVTAANCGVKAMKLRQFCSGAVYYDAERNYGIVHGERMAALDSIVEETSANLLIVYQFVHEKELIAKRYKWFVDIHEPGAIDEWNRGEIPGLLLHAKSAGHGLNLQDGGHHIVYYSPYSDYELYNQVLERIGPVRQLQSGYDRPVYIHHIEAENTVDDRVTRPMREGRGDELELFLNAMAS